jgi:ferrous iron transport protein B
MATRTIENPRDRLTTILITPFMSCGARLPIYILFAGAFFTAHRGLVVFSMYAIGIILAIVTGLVLRKTLLRGPSGHFVMELPPYRLPTITGIIMHTWERGKVFLARAGTIIFCVVVLVWLLDYAGALEPIGRAIAHIFSPLGFGQWQAASALVFGFLAKEVIVGTFGTLFAGAEGLGDLGDVIGSELAWTPLIAFGFMTFCLIYVPCVATIAIMRRETNSWRWPAFTAGYTIVLGWIVAMLIYQIGRLFIG